MSHTYAILDVSYEAYEEIREKLIAAGYVSQIDGEIGSVFEVIDMHGIALQAGRSERKRGASNGDRH